MTNYAVKKVLPIDGNLSFEECAKILVPDDICLGILDENREIASFVLKEDLERVLKFNINDKPVSLIATFADIADINPDKFGKKEIKKFLSPGLNKGVFVGKNRKDINKLIVCKDFCLEAKEIFLKNEYKKNMPDKIKKALEYCSSSADKISLPIFLIGGVVRDIITNKKNFDTDITVEENAVEFSRFLRKEYPDIFKMKSIHDDFKTTKVLFKIVAEEVEIDIASTRKEIYTYPAALPKITEIGCSIKDDISRRDFTVNSMALELNKINFCKLVDPLNGYKDIKEKKIRVLHPLSFIDDPTRIIRGLKFRIRFNYELEKATELLQESCLQSRIFDNLGGERIKSEIKQTFNLNKADCLIKFIEEKMYFLVEKSLQISDDHRNLSKKCQKIIEQYQKHINSKDLTWLIYLGTMLINSSKDEIKAISDRLYLSGMETEILLGGKGLTEEINHIKRARTRFEIYEIFEGYLPESILIGLVNLQDNEVEEKINLYFDELQDVRIYTTGKQLVEVGITPGPIFGEILRELLQAKINNEISTEEAEKEYIKKFIPKKHRSG